MKTILIMSGGLDSGALLAKLLADGADVSCLSFDYGQRHGNELGFAFIQARHFSVPWRLVNLRSIAPLLAGSSQTDSSIPVPEGHYAEESMKVTVVPNRNMIMLSVAVAHAISTKADSVAYAAHAGDHAIYPDCRPEFVAHLANAILAADWHKIEFIAPFLKMTKAEIVGLGSRYLFPFNLTWSCYKGGLKHCGRCSTCVERIEAFVVAGINDPTDYEDDQYARNLLRSNHG